MNESFSEFCRGVLIVITTFNRKKITEICLKNMEETKGEATLWIYDDHSSEYDLEYLQKISPGAKIKRFPDKLGIEKLRVEIQKEALKTSYRYIYHTDNDAYHDPSWLSHLYEIKQKHNRLISLYNTIHHFRFTISQHENFVLRESCPGVSFFFEQSLLKTVPENLYNSWDFVFGDQLSPTAVSNVSYVEHFGSDGLHNSNFEQDRAYNPTLWLKAEREQILKILLN